MARSAGFLGTGTRAAFLLALSGFVAIVVAAPATAGTLDQQQTATDTAVAGFAVSTQGQTFTAGSTGELDQVDLVISREVAITEPFELEIRNVTAGCPSSTVLASKQVPASEVPTVTGDWVAVEFADGADVVAGKHYAIVAYATSASGSYVWYGGTNNPYAAGQLCTSPETPPTSTWSPQTQAGGLDLAFKTYVADRPPATCGGKPATDTGTPGNDELNGTPGNDVIVGLGGNDIVRGFGGNDLVCTGLGRDSVVGGRGGDSLQGGRGNDVLKGGRGPDLLNGGLGRDMCVGNRGADAARQCEVERSI